MSFVFICDICIRGSQSEMCIKNPCALCWIHWLFDIVIHRVLEHSGMLRFRKLWAHPGSRPDFTRKSRMKWWACGACPFAEYGADSFLSWAWLGSVFTRFAQNWIQQQLVVSCWFAWTVDVGLPGASYGSTQAKGSDTFQVDVSCVGLAVDARFVGMS